jgi:hypothetical protein
MSAAGTILDVDSRFPISGDESRELFSSLTEQVVFVLAIVNLVFQEFLCRKQ